MPVLISSMRGLLLQGLYRAGNVEIHTRSSHFDMHGHHEDPMFDNVILHVVAENDRNVFNSRGEELLTAELVFDQALHEKYLSLVNNCFIIACQGEISGFESALFNNWIDSLAVERIQVKSEMILGILSETGNDWEETFYRVLSRYFGFRVEHEPFEMLAMAFPSGSNWKHSDNRFQIESLLYGTSGMLREGLFKEAISDAYYNDLIKEYKILSAKYSLHINPQSCSCVA